MEFTSKKLPNNLLKNVCKTRFSIGYSISCEFAFLEILKHTLFVLNDQKKKFNCFSAYEYSKNAKFYADFKSVEIIGTNDSGKSYWPKTVAN
jgi:hypothetical protein